MPVFAIVWDGDDCIMSGNNAYSSPLNWVGDVAPIKTIDTVEFSQPTIIGACVTPPDDDITYLGQQMTYWEGLINNNAFDTDVEFKLHPSGVFFADMVENCEVRIGATGLRIDNPMGFGIQLPAHLNADICVLGAVQLEQGTLTHTNFDTQFHLGDNLLIEETFDHFAGGGCDYGLSGDGGFYQPDGFMGTWNLNTDNFRNCVYDGSGVGTTSMEVNAPISQYAWIIGPTEKNLLKEMDVIWITDVPYDANYEYENNNWARWDTITIEPDASFLDFDVLNADTMEIEDTTATLTTLANSGYLVVDGDTTLYFIEDSIFDDSLGLSDWAITSELNFDTSGGGTHKWMSGATSVYNMNAVNIDGGHNFFLRTNNINTPNADWTISNEADIVLDGGNLNIGGELNLNGGGDVYDSGANDLIATNINVEAGYSNTINVGNDLTFTNISDATSVSGLISGEINYCNVEYTDLPSWSANSYDQQVGCAPHIVRETIAPVNNAVLVGEEIEFEWSEEFGNLTYYCEIDSEGNNFASPDFNWTTTNTVFNVTIGNLTPERNYEWHCKAINEDGEHGEFSNPLSFFYLYNFKNTCHNNTMAIDYFTAETTPSGETPINRTLLRSVNIPYDFATYGVERAELRLDYNDGIYEVYDIITPHAFTNSINYLRQNKNQMDVDFDLTYNATITGYNDTSGLNCSGQIYEFTVNRALLPEGKEGALNQTGLIYFGVAALFFFMGKNIVSRRKDVRLR